jgi:hypothetical protein
VVDGFDHCIVLRGTGRNRDDLETKKPIVHTLGASKLSVPTRSVGTRRPVPPRDIELRNAIGLGVLAGIIRPRRALTSRRFGR